MPKNQKKSYSRFWENCITNQPIITNNTDFKGPRWRWSNKHVFVAGISKTCLC